MAAFSGARLKRENERDRRARVKQRLAELKAALKAARLARRDAFAKLKVRCKAWRARICEACSRRKELARELEVATRTKLRQEMSNERDVDRWLRQADAKNRSRVLRTKTRGSELRQESDQDVKREIDAQAPELGAVWERVKKHISGSARLSRAEAFMHWAHEHPEEIYSIQSPAEDREFRKLYAEHATMERLDRRKRAPTLEEVPF